MWELVQGMCENRMSVLTVYILRSSSRKRRPRTNTSKYMSRSCKTKVRPGKYKCRSKFPQGFLIGRVNYDLQMLGSTTVTGYSCIDMSTFSVMVNRLHNCLQSNLFQPPNTVMAAPQKSKKEVNRTPTLKVGSVLVRRQSCLVG